MTNSGRLLISLLLLAAPSFAQPTDARISGRVVDNRGAPVAGATVRLFSFSSHVGFALPEVLTSTDGSYVLKTPSFGKGVISAYKTIAGFPDAGMALYGRWEYPSVAQIDATPGAAIHIDLKFSEPDALIEWTVMSAATQAPVPRASYSIEWIDDANIMASSTIPKDGSFRFVLPRHAVVIRIDAPGFKPWTSTNASAFNGPLLLQPGTTDKRSITLEPE